MIERPRSLDEVLGDLRLDPYPNLVVADPAQRLLASPLAVKECAVSSVASCMIAAAELMLARTGRRPEIALDARHVAAAVRSEVWLRDPAGRGIKGFAPLSRVWPAADGWVRTHANYPWHRSALLAAFDVLDGPDTEAELALTEAFADLPALEIEERAYASGALAVAARSVEEWQSSEAGKAVGTSRLVRIEGLANDAPPLPNPGPLPASGLRVLDLTRVIAGPAGTRMLGALGADVLRIDDPHRPELPGQTVDGVIGKTSATLDAATRRGRKIIEHLLGQADVLVSGYRPESLRHLGLEADQVAERHPHVVVVTLSAWGPGPWQTRRGFDSLVQIASGIGWATSPDGHRPGVLPCQLLDHATGYLLAAGALSALARRSRTGQAGHVRLSLARTAKWLLDQPQHHRASDVTPAQQTDEEVADYRVPLGDGWTAIGPPAQLDGHSLSWPHLPPRYGADSPTWGDSRPS